METWVSGERADTIIKNLGFNFNVKQEAEGFSGGIWICWSNADIRIQVLQKTTQLIYCSVKMNGFEGSMTAVYGSPIASRRKEL